MSVLQATPASIQTPPWSWTHFGELADSMLVDIPCAQFVSTRSRTSINRAFTDGTLTRVKVGGSTRIRVSELRTMLGLEAQQ